MKIRHGLDAALGKHLDTAVGQVLYVPFDLMPRRTSLGKVPKAHALHFSAYEEFPCDHRQTPNVYSCKFGLASANRVMRVLDLQIMALVPELLQMKRLLLCLSFVIASALTASAQQRPLLTDDVDITPAGSLELSLGVDFFQDAKFPLSNITGDLTRVGDVRIKTGFSSNVELQIEGAFQNYVAINTRGVSPIPLNVSGNSMNDFDDFTISTKIKLRNESSHLPAVGFKLGFQMPNSDQAEGIGTNQINVFGKVLLQKRFGSVRNGTPRANIFGNLGLMIMTSPLQRFNQNDLFLYGLAGIFRATDNVNIVGEVNGRANTRSAAAPIGTESTGQFRIGTQIKASGLRFDAAAAFGLTKYSPRTGFIFGVTYRTPAIFTPAQ
jgi:hypothetical protein